MVSAESGREFVRDLGDMARLSLSAPRGVCCIWHTGGGGADKYFAAGLAHKKGSSHFGEDEPRLVSLP